MSMESAETISATEPACASLRRRATSTARAVLPPAVGPMMMGYRLGSIPPELYWLIVPGGSTVSAAQRAGGGTMAWRLRVDDSPARLDKGHIAGDKLCVRCGYALRGLSVTGICPECGTPVDRSLRGDLLEYCDPHYARRLLLGARLIIASVYSFVIMLIA